MSLFRCVVTLVIVVTSALWVSAQLVPSDREGLEKGDGLGMAMPAETNGYPGPKHVLELNDSLRLSAAQKQSVEKIFAEMKREAIALGKVIVSAEENLHQAFREGRISEDSLQAMTIEIGRFRGRLRAVHLRAHLLTKAVLTRTQVEKYMRLRGHVKDAHH